MTPNLGWGIVSLFSLLLSYRVDRRGFYWQVLWVMSFAMVWLLRYQFFRDNPSWYIVLDRRTSWAMIHNGWEAFYLEVNPNSELDWGDILYLQGETQPFAFTSYEGLFHFENYLKSRGMHAKMLVDSHYFLFRNPLRLYTIFETRLTELSEPVRSYVAELLWRKQGQSNVNQHDFLDWVSVSGFGFYLTFQMIGKLFSLKLDEHGAKLARLGFFFPYMFFGIHQWGIVRIYGIEVIKFGFPKLKPVTAKVIMLALISWWQPYIWFSPGIYLYLFYQLWLYGFANMFILRQWWQRWLSFALLGMGWSWLSVGKLDWLRHGLFLPTTLINALFMPGWLIYLYTGIHVPFLAPLTRLWIDVLNVIPIQSHDYLGLLPWWRIILLSIGLLSLAWTHWLHLKVYIPYQLMTLGLMVVSHLARWDQWFIHRVSFLNVGQGDATLIQSQGKTMLIDTGGVMHFDIAEAVLIPYFKSQRIRHLDYVVITHDDFDHHGGLPTLTQKFNIKHILKEPFDSIQVGRFLIKNYQHFRPMLDEDNAQSLVIGIQEATCQWLVMGDATVETEWILQHHYPDLSAKIVRLGHHGSHTSTSEAWLALLKPQEVVISLGGGNRYGHPHPSVIERLENQNIMIRRTDQEGTIHYQTCKI